MSEATGVGVIGLGFMGRIHVAAYAAARAAGLSNRLVAIADPRSDSGRGGVGNLAGGEGVVIDADVGRLASAAELLRDPRIELVSICTPTDTHADLAVAALEAGKHVLVEKPLATSVAAVRRVAAAARGSGRLCMPAMCMRFWPGWTWLRERIEDGSLGRLVGVTFTRMGAPPSWSPEFYLNQERSGGALFDLHIHDADFILHCFGTPESVVSQGSANHLTTLYRYPRGRGAQRVVAEGGWGAAAGFPFRMRFTAEFEHATADFEHGRGAPLGPLLLARGGKGEVVPLPDGTAYEAQVRHMLEAVAAFRAGRSFELRATPEDAERVVGLLEAERRSFASGEAQTVSA